MKTDKRSQIISSLRNKEYRDAFVMEQIRTGIPFQVRANRLNRNLTQAGLGQRAEMKQAHISRLENADIEAMPNLNTLARLASALDVALIVRFVPFSELVDWTTGLPSMELAVASFDEDPGLLANRATSTATEIDAVKENTASSSVATLTRVPGANSYVSFDRTEAA